MKPETELKIYALQDIFEARHTKQIYTGVCGGKWRGTSDQYILINDYMFFISNTGIHKFETRLDQFLNTYTGFKRNLPLIAEFLEDIIKKDNELAVKQGLQPIELISVNLAKKEPYLGWFYITLKQGDTIIHHLESNLKYIIEDLANNETPIVRGGDFIRAGALNKHDYIFNNIGFDSKSELYKRKEF